MEYWELFQKGKEYFSEHLTDIAGRYASRHDNALTDRLNKMSRRTECPISGDTSYNAIVNIPVGIRDEKQISIWMSANALESNTPEEISDKVLYNLYLRLIDEYKLEGTKKTIKDGTRLYKKSEILNSLPNWEYIELGKENGVHYLKDLEGVLSVLSTDEYAEHLHRAPTDEENKKKREEKEYLRKLLGNKKRKKGCRDED